MKLRTRTNQPVEGDEIENLNVSGELKAFENIVDKDGHNRFVEGNITMETIDGVTQTYGRWSLSGSHLLIVIAFSVANGTALTYSRIAYVNVPEWIRNKIVEMSSLHYVAKDTLTLFNDDLDEQSTNIYLLRNSNEVWVDISPVTLTADRKGRIAFDLLIDNE